MSTPLQIVISRAPEGDYKVMVMDERSTVSAEFLPHDAALDHIEKEMVRLVAPHKGSSPGR